MIHHWTENEDLLDRFTLSRVDVAMRAELEKHLLDCEACTLKVEEHRKTVGAIRAFGRLDAKSRLKATIDAHNRTRQNVKWILRVAAVFVVVVGLGVSYKFWMSTPAKQTGPSETSMASKPEMQNQVEADVRKSERDVQSQQGSGPGESKSIQSAQAATPSDQHLLATDEKKSGRGADQITFAAPSAQSGAGAGVLNTPIPVGPPSELLEKKAAKNIKEDIRLEPDQIWVEGVVLAGIASEPEIARERLNNMPSGQRESQALQKDARGDVHSLKNFEVLQLYRREVVQGKPKYTATTNSVRTLVDRSDERVKLYLDMVPELSEAEARNARVEQVSTDSIVVTVRGMRFGYRIPSGSPTKSAK